MVDSCGIVIASTRGFGKGIICVVYELKLPGSFWAFGRVDWNSIGVGFEGCSKSYMLERGYDEGEQILPLVCITDLLLGRRRGYTQDGICKQRSVVNVM